VAAVVVVLAGLAAGCGTVHPTLDDLRAVPGGTLQYAGSVEITSGDQESSSNLMAKNGAVLKSYRCANAARTEWAPWFVGRLEEQGWTQVANPSFAGGGDDTLVGEWRRGDYLFDLYELSADHLAALESQYGDGAPCTDGYETLMR
jgi:hypothetical protein